ncbi:MAG: radical SAM protein [Anaerolineales bacterium]|nr:radical SAM protein [Anaerolineales bacterium]
MEKLVRMSLLASSMDFEPDGEQNVITPKEDRITKMCENIPISHATLPNGKKIKLLKTMMTSVCENDCHYCAFRSGRDLKRTTLTPDDMAQIIFNMQSAKMIDGAFISSGVAGGGVRSQDKIIAAAEILRTKYDFKGYLHVKIMPGAEQDQIIRAMELGSRVSVNLEAPNPERLSQLAPSKIFIEELFKPLRFINHVRSTIPPTKSWNGLWPSSTTQFVVGASGESDLELLATSDFLIRSSNLRRIYYMAFNPVIHTPLENHTPTNPMRQHRLYQCSFLIRDYGFVMEDLPLHQGGYLPLNIDPKTAWAMENIYQSPVEINRADKQSLLRVPGIGLRGAANILLARKQGKISTLEDLHKIGIRSKRTAPFILLNGKRPEYQLGLL